MRHDPPSDVLDRAAGAEVRFEKRHELVHRVLRANIQQGRFPRGLVLLEMPLAGLLQTSRAPVQKALRRLEGDKLVHRFDGRGFLVGQPGAGLRPIRTDLRELGLLVSDDVDEALQARGSWERIAADVEAEVAGCVVFGQFRIVEAELAEHYRVSRTVVRDVLGRLQERGLLRKLQARWIAGPLTAKIIKDRYALRAVLEPAALAEAAPSIDRSRLLELRDRASGAEGHDGDPGVDAPSLFRDFLEICVLGTRNEALADAIGHNLMPLEAVARSLDRLGLPHDETAVSELRIAIDLLLNGSARAAAEWWRDHLAAACKRSIAQLKIVAIIERPRSFAPYLTAV